MWDQLNLQNAVLMSLGIFLVSSSMDKEPIGVMDKIAEPSQIYEVQIDNRSGEIFIITPQIVRHKLKLFYC